MADDEGEGVGLPQKGLNMIIKDALPEMRIANETRELLNQCCVEFIKHVSKEAQLISSKDQRKTIYHDHVQKALKKLGFPREYVDAANSVLGECKIAAEKRLKRKNSRLDKCGIPEEQLWQMQQRLIEQARRNEAEKQQTSVLVGGPSQFGAGDLQQQFQMLQQQQQLHFQPQYLQQSQQTPFIQSLQFQVPSLGIGTLTPIATTTTSEEIKQPTSLQMPLQWSMPPLPFGEIAPTQQQQIQTPTALLQSLGLATPGTGTPAETTITTALSTQTGVEGDGHFSLQQCIGGISSTGSMPFQSAFPVDIATIEQQQQSQQSMNPMMTLNFDKDQKARIADDDNREPNERSEEQEDDEEEEDYDV